MINNVAQVKHPLEPLTAEEIELATKIIKEQKSIEKNYRFTNVSLIEPPKDVVLNFNKGDSFDRKVFFILLNKSDAKTYEATVSLQQQKIISWIHVPVVQPNVMLEEFFECEKILKNSPDMKVALQKRGIENLNLVMLDPWSAGNFGHAEEKGVRLVRALCWYKTSKFDNGYARPISGLFAYIDLNKMEVVKVVDNKSIPLPPLDGNYTADSVEKYRDDIKPLDIIQPEGPSFQIDGHEIDWQKWKIRFGFNAREGLVLHTVSYNDDGRDRPILYRASLSEMVVPYGDPTEPVNRNNAFDAGEYGIGMLANSLEFGCDCLGEIRYFDGVLSDSNGDPVVITNAICLHEEDDGILWKHTDWRTEEVEVRRSRRLVLSSISTVGNYEYGFYWYFYQDGTIDYEVKLTGILHTSAIPPEETSIYGKLVAPQLLAPHHQHFFNMRLDMMVDGMNNSVYEVNTESDTVGPHNPYKNGFIAKSSLLKTESEARRNLKLETARYWKIVNQEKKNIIGEPVGYKLITGENTFPFAHDDSSLIKRAGFLKNHLWVTPFHQYEKYAAGDYINQHEGGEGLPKWTKANRSTENTDIVVWYTMGHHHICRPEDWPVMPVAKMGFSLKPLGFFDRNPSLDVPAPKHNHGSHCNHN
ncbi:primary-amine oxidase [Alteribacillus sp. JSM 102045]|uniref:primary-amine oxidase n=1 Tax=Alteribacillus sp. JSM 102045 TaxID=1562101 RepID=UPI0035BFB332